MNQVNIQIDVSPSLFLFTSLKCENEEYSIMITRNFAPIAVCQSDEDSIDFLCDLIVPYFCSIEITINKID